MIRAELEHITTQINGLQMHIVQAGPTDGTPLLLLHGFPEYWYGWRNQIDPLVDAGFRLYIPDQRGYNKTDKPAGYENYNLDLVADDMLALFDYMGVERANVIAHDWGGQATWWCANRNPERFQQMALLNIPHHNVFSKFVRTHPQQRKMSRYIAFFQLPIIPELACKAFNFRLLANWAFGNSDAFTQDDLKHYKQAWARDNAVSSMIDWYRAVRKAPPKRLESKQIHVKTLLIWGKQDHALMWQMAQPSIDLCDDGQLVLIDDASHWVQHEAVEQVNRHLIDYFSS
jgi:epoxide hydrolase 4